MRGGSSWLTGLDFGSISFQYIMFQYHTQSFEKLLGTSVSDVAGRLSRDGGFYTLMIPSIDLSNL